MAAVPVPQLRPSAGFCVQTESTTGSPSARWYVNMTKHKMVEMPLAYSGKQVDREYILTHGIANLQIPFDVCSFRKLKMRSDGAKQTTFCIDVIFTPLIVQLFMEDDFCKVMENFRQFIINLALKRIDESIGVKLSVQKVTLVKKLRYKDGEDGDDTEPREYADLPGSVDCFDEEMPKKPSPPKVPESEGPLIEEVTQGRRKPAMKKGFLNSNKASAELYPNGSGEGVIPENAGDPMGWMPKKLRNSCKIIDTNSPEYQETEKKKQAADNTNSMNQEMKDTMMEGMNHWTKKNEHDKWEQDLPDGTENDAPKKYDNDYSRFNNIADVNETPAMEDRDWYYDSAGKRQQIQNKQSAPASAIGNVAEYDTIKKGFLSDARKPLYPKGSEQCKAALDEEQLLKKFMEDPQAAQAANPELLKELMKEAGALTGSIPQTPPAAKPPMNVKVPECKAAEFSLSETDMGLQLVVKTPGLDSMKGVNLDVTEKRASLAFPGSAAIKPLQVELPAAVNPQAVRAKFSKKTQHVTITLPFAA